MKQSLFICCVLLLRTMLCAAQEGIFADFTTSMGSFTAQLHYQDSPATVANFIGLAEGSRPYIDAKTGAIVTGKPYYDGLIFHRVISNFMIQGGCPLGTGTSGPGYRIRDEVENGLSHNQSYRLSMANAGGNTGGSQFFITVSSPTHLDGKHSIFGDVVSGMSVIDAIKMVPTNASDRPLTNVVMQQVRIRRVGTAAAAFDIHAQGLPVCSWYAGSLDVKLGNSIRWMPASGQPTGSVVSFYRSENLATWTAGSSMFVQPGVAHAPMSLGSVNAPRAFYQMALTHYPDAASGQMASRTVAVKISDTSSITFHFDASGNAGDGLYVRPTEQIPFTFTLFEQQVTPLQQIWVMNTSFAGGLRVDALLDTATPAEFRGRVNFSQWNGLFWNPLSAESVTVTR